MSYGILTDITKCIGCLECVSACKKTNNLDSDVPRIWQKNDGLSADNWTAIIKRDEHRYVRKQCRHCLEPACAAACPVGALHQTEQGTVVYEDDKCLGCRYCMMACPYGIPRYDWDLKVPYVRKCIMCYDQIKKGDKPSCTSACPTEATIFGKRDELLKSAHQTLKDNPDKYINKIWGETEIGGTSVLYISDIDLDFLAYKPNLGTKPLPATTAPAMKAVPYAFFGMGGVMMGLKWIVGRRNKLQNSDSENKESGNE